MCGIAGILQLDDQPVDQDRLRSMNQALAHRGPDAEGFWIQGSIGLAHRRLAIVDLSPTGAQPMQNPSSSLVLTYNGEIYNYQELRKELEAGGASFTSTSDSEVLLLLYERVGEKMLERLRGMFAFAIWDAKRHRLFFARDRIGKKPFFYQHGNHSFSFASELKALIGQDKPKIDWEAIRLFFGLQYIPAPRTGFEGIFSLQPGECGWVEGGRLTIKRYAQFLREPKRTDSFQEAALEVRHLVEESVRLRLIADVPVGAFLSGGIDSSIVATLMAKQSSTKIHTFTMGFSGFSGKAGSGYAGDEREEARQLAKKIGTEHHEFEARVQDIPALVETMLDIYDAPYADSSCLPVWLLARETRAHIKAVMVGDGGDELFGGYRRYQAMLTGLAFHRSHVGWLISWLARGIGSMKHDPRYLRFARMTEKFSAGLGQGYASLFSGSYFSDEEQEQLLEPGFCLQTAPFSSEKFIVQQFIESLGAEGALDFDLTSYLPDDLNVKVDRATMAHGLEARAPFLDQELVRYTTHLPLSFILKRGIQKPLLRAAFTDIVPKEVFDRRKRGFQVPLAEWFRKDLRSLFVERCLASGNALRTICQSSVIERYLKENDAGVNHGNRLWMLLMLGSWLEKYGN